MGCASPIYLEENDMSFFFIATGMSDSPRIPNILEYWDYRDAELYGQRNRSGNYNSPCIMKWSYFKWYKKPKQVSQKYS